MVANAEQPDEATLVTYLRARKLYIATPGVTRDVLQENAQVIGPPRRRCTRADEAYGEAHGDLIGDVRRIASSK
ncbi:MAG: hypothetical protein HOV81_01755 [Kofleriaceae bacterium]|nr:hypothetical protein [Kofleriaceae bacterium]